MLFRLSAQRKDNTYLQFCFTNVCLLVFSILRFHLCKYPMKLFARVFRLFLRVFYFATVFPIFDDDFSLNECYVCACQIQVRIRKKNCKIDLGVYLSLIQVGLFLYPSKNEVWLLDVCLS